VCTPAIAGKSRSSLVAPLYSLSDKLATIIELTNAEREALYRLPMHVMTLRADQDIVRQGDRPTRCCVLLEGLACASIVTAEGRRQISAFHVRGDIPDLQSLHLSVLDNSVSTVTACVLGFIPHEALLVLCDNNPRLARMLWRETPIYSAIFRQWLVNVGQREAYSRMAHLLCETVTRLQVVGLAEEGRCSFPVTQAELADATGMTSVHVNRTLQQVRKAGLIRWRNGDLEVLDWAGLKRAAGFDPTYLHLEPAKHAA
jgi:CRP-like cAMP-binding protein